MPMKEERYEIVPIDPWSKAEKKSEDLEKEIREIKAALKGTVGLTKMEGHADEFIERIMSMVTSSQKMVTDVAKTNKTLSEKINLAIEEMTRANMELSDKISQLMEFFSEEGEGGEGEDFGDMDKTMKEMKNTLEHIADQNEKTTRVLESIERHLKKQRTTSTSRGYAPPPGGFPPPPSGGPPPLPPPPAPP